MHCGERQTLESSIDRSISLKALYDDWSTKMERVCDISKWLPGCRILKQEPWETLISFLVSANNASDRTHSILTKLRETYGTQLCQVSDTTFYSFPSLADLKTANEKTFKQLGFGYRAQYMVKLCQLLDAKGGEEYLRSLRTKTREEVRAALTSFPGIGAKVADCVALYSLDQGDAIPVDTFIYRLARQYFPDAHPQKTSSLTPKIVEAIGESFRGRFGRKAGWVSSLLTCAEFCPSFQEILPDEYQSKLHLELTQRRKTREKITREKLAESSSAAASNPSSSSESVPKTDSESRSESSVQVRFPHVRELRSGAVLLMREEALSPSDSDSCLYSPEKPKKGRIREEKPEGKIHPITGKLVRTRLKTKRWTESSLALCQVKSDVKRENESSGSNETETEVVEENRKRKSAHKTRKPRRRNKLSEVTRGREESSSEGIQKGHRKRRRRNSTESAAMNRRKKQRRNASESSSDRSMEDDLQICITSKLRGTRRRVASSDEDTPLSVTHRKRQGRAQKRTPKGKKQELQWKRNGGNKRKWNEFRELEELEEIKKLEELECVTDEDLPKRHGETTP